MREKKEREKYLESLRGSKEGCSQVAAVTFCWHVWLSCCILLLLWFSFGLVLGPVSLRLFSNEVASVMTVWNQLQPAYAANMWNEALNKRLGTKGLSLPDILVEVEKRISSFVELLTIPEQDDWVYSNGKSTSCVAFFLEMYKEVGLFGELASLIQVTEFTIKDAYSLKFFENNSNRLPKWCNAGDIVKLPFYQIKGKYHMELPGYNTMDIYPHMNEKCPPMPPKYYKPESC